jgi:hypothetical protein
LQSNSKTALNDFLPRESDPLREGKRRGTVMKEEKTRIVVEISDEDYKLLVSIKNFLNLSWRDILIAGIDWWCKELKLEERIERIKESIDRITELKN